MVGPEGLPVVEIAADGEKFRVLLDTGTADLIVGESLARKIVVPTDAIAPVALGGPAVPQGQVDELVVGDAKLTAVPIVVFPDEHIRQMAGVHDILGVIGMRTLSGFQITVDPSARRIDLVKNDRRCADALSANRRGLRIETWLHETHYLYALARLNGREGLYLVNTGLRGAALTATESAYARAGIGPPPIRAGEPPMVAIEELSLGEGHKAVGLAGAFGYLAQEATSDGFRLDGMLGLEAFGGARFTVDFGDRAIWLDTATGSAATPPAKP
jgi:predicted aspartyl protease